MKTVARIAAFLISATVSIASAQTAASGASKLAEINIPAPQIKAAVAPLYLVRAYTSFSAINDAGIVAGYVVAKVTATKYEGVGIPPYSTITTAHKAFTYKDGIFKMIPDPVPSLNTDSLAINNRNQVLLQVGGPGQAYFLYDLATGTARPISLNVSVHEGGNTAVARLSAYTGMNDSGELVGYVRGGRIAYGKPSLGAPGDTTPPVDAAPFTMVSAAACPNVRQSGGINNHDDIVGVCGLKSFVAKGDGTVVPLTLPAGDIPIAYILDNGLGINDSGLVVGSSAVNTHVDALMCKDGTCSRILPDESGAAHWIRLNSVNNRGQLVGNFGGRSFSAFLYRP